MLLISNLIRLRLRAYNLPHFFEEDNLPQLLP